VFGFTRAEYFEAEEPAVRAAPTVDFGAAGAGAGAWASWLSPLGSGAWPRELPPAAALLGRPAGLAAGRRAAAPRAARRPRAHRARSPSVGPSARGGTR